MNVSGSYLLEMLVQSYPFFSNPEEYVRNINLETAYHPFQIKVRNFGDELPRRKCSLHYRDLLQEGV